MPSSTPSLDADEASVLDEARKLSAAALEQAKHALMASFPFLDVALWRMPIVLDAHTGHALSCDGRILHVDAARLVMSHRESPADTVRDLLHCILHCVFHHPFDARHANTQAWDLSCDIAVEACAMELIRKGYYCPGDDERAHALERLGEACPTLTAEKLYRIIAPCFESNCEGHKASSLISAHISAHKPTLGKKAGSARHSKITMRMLHDRIDGFAQEEGLLDGVAELERPSLSPRFVTGLADLFARDDHGAWPRTSELELARMRMSRGVELMESDSEQHIAGDMQADAKDDPQDSVGVDMPGAPAPSSSSNAVEALVDAGDALSDMVGSGSAKPSIKSLEDAVYSDFADMSWQDISKQIEIDMEAFTGKIGTSAGSLMVNLSIANRKRYDYREFLKRFSTMQEEMKVSTEEFDYIYYTYGLSRYRNMPLVEPLEYQDSDRIRDFVIAIDTSASCAGHLVQSFAEKTYDVLKNSQGFGRKVNIHLVQCDCDITSDVVITELRDITSAFDEFSTRGYGGTDFRPVFRYVDDLIESHELTKLKGLIYFTDGLGVYPDKPPDYETVFVFLDEDDKQRHVPPWAMKVVMDEDDIREL